MASLDASTGLRDCPWPPLGASLNPTAPAAKGRALTERGEWERLLAAANAGDRAAFARFLTEVSPMLRGIIRARAASMPADQHEDILQEVLLAVHLKRGTWHEDRPVRPWLYAVARHKIVDAFRKRGQAVHLPIESFAETLAAPQASDPMAARDAAAMLDRIDDRSAALVRAIAIDGESADSAGARLGLGAGAARVRMHRAMKRLSALAERMTK